jgi:outer membrane protein assembly factor BamB
MLALNKMTGKKVWQSNEWTDDAQYGSIVPAQINGVRQYIALTQKNIGAINPKDGRKLWLSEFPGKTAVIPTPIVLNNDVYVAAGYGVGCKQVHVAAGNAVNENWSNTNMVNHHGGVVLYQDHLYGYSDKGGWTCQDWKSGEVKWSDKSLGKGAIHCADGMLYLLEENSGTVALIEASPAGFKEHSRFKLDPQTTQRNPKGKIWTHPVVANGRLYLRDQELLFCFDVSDPAAPKTAAVTSSVQTAAAQQTFTDWKQAEQAVLKQYPDLGVPGSPFNHAFISKVEEARQIHPELLKNPNWPVIIAREVAATLVR